MAEAALHTTGAREKSQTQQSTVLGREMGLGAVFIFSLSSIGLAYSGAFPFSIIAGQFAGSSLVAVILAAVLVSMVHAYTYALIGALAPRYGADYLLASRVVSAPLAFASSWTLVVFLSVFSGTFVAAVAQNTVPMFARILSTLSGDNSLVTSVSWAGTPNGIVLLGTLGVVAVFLLLILPPRVTRRVLLVGAALLVIAWGALYFQMLSAPQGTFQASWDQFMGPGSYQSHLDDAFRHDMTPNPSLMPAISAGLLLCFWIFYGYFNPSLISGEVKRPERDLLFGSWGALALAGGLLLLGVVFLQRQVPPEWISAESYLSQMMQYRTQAMPWLPLYAAILRPSAALTWLVGIAWVFTILNLAHTFLYTASRMIFAWVADGLVPEAVTAVHPVLRSPLVAVLVVSILAEIGVVDAGLNGSLLQRFNPLFFIVAVQIIPLLGLVLLPFRKPDWFAAAVPFARGKIGRLPVVTLMGGVSLVFLAVVITANSVYRILGGIGLPSIAVFLVIFATGLAWFYGRRYLLKSQGQEIDAALKETP